MKRKTKKALALMLIVLVGSQLTACMPSTQGSYLSGLGIVTTLDSSKSAGAQDGLAQSSSTVAAVVMDGNGRIQDCQIDTVESKVSFTSAGEITTDLKAQPKSKDELGAAYGMKAVSSISKEWYEQADAFAAWTIGKTANDISSVALDGAGKATTPDVVSGATISVSAFRDAVLKAIENARAPGANPGNA